MSNNLGLTSRRFTINHLVPDTYYSFKIRANNPSGSVETQFEIFTASNLTLKSQSPEETGLERLGSTGNNGADQLVLQQIQMIVPVAIGILIVVILVAGIAVCFKRSEFTFSPICNGLLLSAQWYN